MGCHLPDQPTLQRQNPDLKVLKAENIQDAHRLKVFLAFDLRINLANEP